MCEWEWQTPNVVSNVAKEKHLNKKQQQQGEKRILQHMFTDEKKNERQSGIICIIREIVCMFEYLQKTTL